MARRLLDKKPVCYRGGMRHSALLVLLGLSGCLYIGGINHPPEGEVVVVSSTPAKQGDWVELSAAVSDPDGDGVHYAWTVDVTDKKTNSLIETFGLDDDAVDGGSSGEHRIQPVGEGLARVKVSGFTRGNYTVRLTATDDRGAFRELTGGFAVENQPPVIKLVLDIEDVYKTTDHFPDTGFKDGKIRNPAHGHYVLYLNDLESTDHEGDLACGGGGTITYTLVKPSTDLLDYWDTVACKQGGKLDRLRFRFDPAKVTQAETVEIDVTVDDGHGGVVSETTSLDVVPNRPACIPRGEYDDGTAPPVPPTTGGLKVPVIAAQGLSLEVRFVSDDVDEGHIFSWYVRDAQTSSFELLQRGSSPALKLDPWFRMPGQEVQLRAVVADPQLGSALPSCAPDTPLCPTSSAVLPDEDDCYQWVSWNLTFL